MTTVAVLGAGFQGVGVALELAARGVRVDLYDRHNACITQAGANNEGKIHLGFVYANDPTFETAQILVRGALVFGPAIARWLERDITEMLLSQARHELVCIVSHDDLPAPTFLERLVSSLAAEPDCVLAFTDIQVFGLLDHVEHQRSIEGAMAERIRAFIAGHHDGTAFHGLIRRRAIRAAGGLRGNVMDHFAADVAWLARLAAVGGFRRVPEPLYQKRRHAASASLRWELWDDAAKAEAWTLHGRELLRDALAHAMTGDDQRLVVDAALRRVLAIEPELPFRFIRGLARDRHTSMVAAISSELRRSPSAAVRSMAREDPHAILVRLRDEAAA